FTGVLLFRRRTVRGRGACLSIFARHAGVPVSSPARNVNRARWMTGAPPGEGKTMTLQREIIEALGAKSEIDPAVELERRRDFLVDYLRSTGARGLVLGISGGQDSSLAGRLAQLAVERIRAE